MFLQIELKSKEVIAINVYQVLYITPKNEKYTYLFDSCDMEYLVNESYESLFSRLNSIKNF